MTSSDNGSTSDTAAQRISALEHELAAAQQQLALYQAVIDGVPSVIYTTDLDGTLLLVNQAFTWWVGKDRSEIIGQRQADLFPAELVAYWQTQSDQVIASGQPFTIEEESAGENGLQVYLSQRSPILDADGTIVAVAGMATDVTSLRQAERDREQLQSAVIEAQQAALRELNTPLIPITDDVVVMPLIGSMDSNRAQQVLETLLEGVARNGASSVILDITGLPVVDTQVASVLLQATKAVSLLGAEVILTGIGPEIAQTLIGIGADLSTITTPGTLQNGIAYALKRAEQATK